MNNKMIPGLLLGFSMWGVTANAAQFAITCDRACLRRQKPRCGSVHENLSGGEAQRGVGVAPAPRIPGSCAQSREATATQTQPEDGTDTSVERVIPAMP